MNSFPFTADTSFFGIFDAQRLKIHMQETITYQATREYAEYLDKQDELASFREHYLFPKKNGNPVIYFTGNSLDLQPIGARKIIGEELEKWADLAVDGHFEGRRPWLHYHTLMKAGLSAVVGAKESEVVPMNNLTSNLHFMMVSFYRPTSDRFKIIMEAGAFPSDQYAVESQVRFHGLDPEEAIIEIEPSAGEYTLRQEDILATIKEHGDQTALVLMSGVQYFTGQFFDLESITRAAHEAGAFAGWDLAHAVGNVPLSLHDDNVDFAVWCSYKYLNSGPGGVSGIFVHERHGHSDDLPRFAGWWGHDQNERFLMEKGFKPMEGADGWQMSNMNILGTAAHIPALTLFQEAGMENLRSKSLQLTGFLDFLLHSIDPEQTDFQILTPSNPNERGCQLSIFFPKNGKKVFDFLAGKGIVTDWRENQLSATENHSGVIRVAPTPMYNSYLDVYRFSQQLKAALENVS